MAGVTRIQPPAPAGPAAPMMVLAHTASAGNSGTTETDLFSGTVAAGAPAATGDCLVARYGGQFVLAAVPTRRLRVYFAGSAIFDSGPLTVSLGGSWVLDGLVMRVSASVVRYTVTLSTAALTATVATGVLTGLALGSATVLKLTGQAAGIGAASNDILALCGTVQKIPAS